MKKRILSILLVFCMMMSFVPITVFAAGGAKAILPGTSAQSILKIDKSRLSFSGHEWWVIGQKTDKSNNAPIITLLAVNNDFGDVPFRTGSDGPFENARRYSEDNGYYANNPSDMSQWRKPNEYAGSTLQQKMVSLAEAIPEKEQAVIRPKDITEGITGQEVKAQKLWAFSQEDSIYLYRNSCKYAAKWWTRSSNEVYGYGSWTIHPDGRSGSALNVDYDAAVRPAMEMDLSSVLFISAAEHGKVADLTTPIAEYAGDEWKLTLHDSDRDDFTAKTVLVNGSVLEVEYKNAKVGDNEYISAVIKDADGSISRYTRVVQLDGTTNGTRGRAAIDLTGIDMTGKTLCVFNEQFNGDHKTDYAGALREVKLTDEIDEQFTLTPGGTYYFDLSGANIPGTANGSLPDSTLHYVPFTYTGTVYAYSLSSNSSGVASSSQAASTAASSSAQYGYARDHSLFIADYAVAHTVSWLDLNAADLIFGKDYASGKISYALRAPSVGSNHKLGSDADEHGDPENNEWDAILNKARQDWQDNTTGYIKNWKDMYSTGQDTAEAPSTGTAQRMKRGYPSVRRLSHSNAGTPLPYDGFRPVLEVLRADMLGSDALKTVALDLNGGSIGDATGTVNIVVKNGESFTAPSGVGLTRPSGNTDSYFWWLGSDGKSYVPGAMIPAGVASLTAQWTALTYSVTLHENGGTLSSGNVTSYNYGEGATLPTAGDMTREGYTFAGWYDNEALTGTPVMTISNTEMGNKEYWAQWEINQYTVTVKPENGEADITITQDYGTPIAAPADPTREGYTFIGWDKAIPTTMPAENMTITAKWKVNQYTITFDTNGGSEITPITQDYGTAITAPANPTREGYTFIGWDKAIPTTMPAENMIITAKWKVNQYTITFDSNGGSKIAPITQDYGTAITAPANPTREGYTFIGWDKAIPATMPAENMIITAKWRDIAVPTGEIKIAENGWKSFLNTITFGLFFKDTQMVTVTAADNSGEAVKIEYLLSDKALTESELAGMTFTAYSAPFSINPDNEYVIYAKLTDTSGNFAYINTNGIVLDATVPGISGIADGKTYCAAQTVTVTEKYIGTVKVNGTEVSLDKNSQFVLSPASGKQTIVVTDKAGNETRVTVTVNNGHTYEWQSGNGQYWQKCKFCNHETAKKDIPTINISGADKVCRTQDYKFSFTLPEGATGAAYGYEFIGFGDGPLTPTVENGLYSGIIKASAYPAKENSFKLIVSAKTADGFAFSAEKTVTIQNEHTGGTATCKDKAICEVCGESYGKLDPNNHANLKHIDAKAATKTSEGNIEYWYCDGCNKYYKDAKATQEITKAQTVTAKLPPKITAGDGAAVTQGEKKELTFTSDASFADFLRVELDGTTLDEKNYTKKEGSTIITLNRDFVATLSVGEHTLAIVSQHGTATAKFTVKAKPAETATPQPTVTPQPTAQPQPTVQPVSPIPRTGDTANPALWFALLIVSGSALAAIFVLRRKANRK